VLAGDEYLSAMAAEVKAKAREGNAQNVANMLWSFATLGAQSQCMGLAQMLLLFL
jgi:hypothetical protein